MSKNDIIELARDASSAWGTEHFGNAMHQLNCAIKEYDKYYEAPPTDTILKTSTMQNNLIINKER